MQVQFSEIKLIELFVDIDDLLKRLTYQQSRQVGQTRRPTRVPAISQSEVCTILAAYPYRAINALSIITDKSFGGVAELLSESAQL